MCGSDFPNTPRARERRAYEGAGVSTVSENAARERRAPLERLAFTAMEAPAVLGVSWGFFNEHVAGELRWVRRGSKKLVARVELERWLRENAARTLEDDE